MNDLSEQEEHDLNPAPKSYRVPMRAKIIFLVFSVAGLGLYGAMLVDRRMSEHRYHLHQELSPIMLNAMAMPNMQVVDPVNNLAQELSFSGKTYTLLNMWATWCPPCQQEMPSLSVLQQHLQGKLRVVALSVDEDQSAVVEFIKKHNPAFTVLWDKDKASLKYLGVEKYPETFLISPDGYLTTQFSGPRDWASPQVFDYFLNVLK